jgi:hypothetical protein
MNPLLLAILGAVAHADGNTPTLTPLPTDEPTTVDKGPADEPVTYDIGPDSIEGELVKPSCVTQHPRGTPDPLPIANASDIARLESECKMKGGAAAMCDASQMVSMAAAMCASELDPVLEVRIGVYDTGMKPRLVWRVQRHTGYCGGTTDYVDGWSAEVIGSGRCVYGRPATTSKGVARARLVRRQGWA